VTFFLLSLVGLLVSAVLVVVGLRMGDRWLAVAAAVSAVAFVSALLAMVGSL
jgi:hypothetical protein